VRECGYVRVYDLECGVHTPKVTWMDREGRVSGRGEWPTL
jgi:hypothetical protein